jgi:hypothetical protein
MPILALNLTNRRFYYEANEESKSRKMLFDAQLDIDDVLRRGSVDRLSAH